MANPCDGEDFQFLCFFSFTEVARESQEASDIILMVDNSSSIVKAIMWGRCVNDVDFRTTTILDQHSSWTPSPALAAWHLLQTRRLRNFLTASLTRSIPHSEHRVHKDCFVISESKVLEGVCKYVIVAVGNKCFNGLYHDG